MILPEVGGEGLSLLIQFHHLDQGDAELYPHGLGLRLDGPGQLAFFASIPVDVKSPPQQPVLIGNVEKWAAVGRARAGFNLGWYQQEEHA